MIYRMFCRLFQAVMKAVMYALPWHTPDVLEGDEALKRMVDDIENQGINKVMVVMGPSMMKRGLPQSMLDIMSRRAIQYVIFDKLTSDPTDEQVESGARRYREAGCQGMVLFGGGSPMDCGKAIAARIARPGKSVKQLQGALKVRHRKDVPLMWAVPTTAGTGSETTMAAVISDSVTHRKKSINDPSIIPHVCVLDPALTAGLSPEMTAYTGMDALCHAVEAYINKTYNTEREDKMAKDAVKLIHDNLIKVYHNGGDVDGRRKMQLAAFFAGRAFTRGCVGYVHAIGHGIGGLYGFPHGKVMAVLLPYVLEVYGSYAEERLAELADACGIMDGERAAEAVSDREKAIAFINWIRSVDRQLAIPEKLRCIKAEDVPTIARWAAEEANPLYPVPKILVREELEKLIIQIAGSPEK